MLAAWSRCRSTPLGVLVSMLLSQDRRGYVNGGFEVHRIGGEKCTLRRGGRA